jgi:hypothetical protein
MRTATLAGELTARTLRISALLLLALACDQNPSMVPTDPSFAGNVLPIFSVACAGCHSGPSPAGSYVLTSRAGAVSGGSDTVPNVRPGSPDSSTLYRRITGADQPRMPLGSAALDTIQTGTVRNWILRGAQDN